MGDDVEVCVGCSTIISRRTTTTTPTKIISRRTRLVPDGIAGVGTRL